MNLIFQTYGQAVIKNLSFYLVNSCSSDQPCHLSCGRYMALVKTEWGGKETKC